MKTFITTWKLTPANWQSLWCHSWASSVCFRSPRARAHTLWSPSPWYGWLGSKYNLFWNLQRQKNSKNNHIVIWFWEVVVRDDFDQETKARLLQFVTGTSGVPSRGFSVLQGNDGNIKKFAIHGVDRNSCFYPQAHTCFNRLDLPDYQSKKELEEKLRVAVTTSCIGFGIE